MSLRYVKEFASALPYSLSSQVVGYATSVDDRSKDIFSDAGVGYDAELSDQLTLLAGIRKLYEILSSSYWIADSAISLLGRNVKAIRVGTSTFERGSRDYVRLAFVVRQLEQVLSEQEIPVELLRGPYDQILAYLVDGRPKG